jgi:hypothetical protein
MIKPVRLFGILTAAILMIAAASVTSAKDYQVSGPVLEVTETKIVVQKGEDKWEIHRDKDTKGGEKVKVGDKVTIKYKMFATSIEAK